MNKNKETIMDDNQEQKKKLDKVREKVYAAALKNNMQIFEECLSDNYFPEIPKDIKEAEIWDELTACVGLLELGEEFLAHLIFKYKINEDFLNKINPSYKNPVFELAKTMFENRKLNEDLNIELSFNNNKDKRFKV